MTHCVLQGGCHCGQIGIEVELPRPASSYTPRVCDCEYCRKHGAAWVSHPGGRLRVTLRDPRALGRYRQGAGLADFLFCKDCGVLVGVAYAEGEQLYATVNIRVIDGAPGFPAPAPVSPKTLSAADKATRWKTAWFHEVTIAGDGTPD